MTSLLKVCRICLAYDVRMFKILNTNFQDVYEKLTDITLNSDDGRPIYACYMCHTSLKKCYNFRMKSLRANESLTQLLANGTELTFESLRFIDRDRYNFVDGLSITCLENYHIKSCLSDDNDRVIVKQENVPIKCEVVIKDEQSYKTDDLTEMNRQLDYELDYDYNLYFDPEHKIPLNSTDLRENFMRTENPHTSTVQMGEGTPINKKPKQDVQKKSPKKWVTEIKAEQDVNTVKNYTKITDKQNLNLPAITTNKKTEHENHLTNNTITETSMTNMTKTDKNINIPQNDSNSYVPNDNLFVCKNSAEECLTKINLTTNIESDKHQTQDIYFKCDECSYKSVTQESLNKHLEFHDKKRPFVCEHCGYRFKRELHMKDHIITHTGDKPYPCNICEKKFNKKSILTTHLKLHSGDKAYACDMCDYKSAQREGLLSHLKKHSGDKPYACNICEYKCIRKVHLVRHLKKHSGNKSYACNICEYKGIEKNDLLKHLKSHSDYKPYACNICEYKFKQRSHLNTHLKIHSGDRPHACNICEYKSIRKSTLIKHLKKHSDEKPYTCNICEYKFKLKNHLIRHLKIHSGDKPYACNICDYKSVQKQGLLNHLRIHGGD